MEAVVEFKKEAVESIQTVFAGKSTRLERGADGWTVSSDSQETLEVSANTTKPDPTAIEGFLDRLIELQAGRRTGTHESLVKALETPLLSITVTLPKAAPAQKVSLLLGHPIKDGSFPATVTGKEGVFLLNEANEATLEKAIASLQRPSPSPENSPSGQPGSNLVPKSPEANPPK
jgi:hypothetical protein